ncbi:MAG: DUF3157 family protein [Flavobacteriales bacterium]|nr:DUF3157 family protein [Flavobacteriia bacterium]NCP05358.1 DUF3157 family protein [Flavobacteriales bacterium]PIV92547.1 MAG: DUF3157 domain-containing protein [Flavobacteriaceae bacterium CG17_big_fil_post_rev_8_21_14_2_50_33_15]PIY12649.1 MAG: DUF3157 domain-containing protein [Flavobacteriaceae bacterium CG_4_10_14_3_um_filter_33_47]PJB18091.1 MAG: DUF3157 domain-containing protein [Flavobacteriaceae bacterium CG_4_9_14_3_um_filter_33_16]
MKTTSLLLLFFITSIGFSQNNHIVKIDDGRRILLKADYTWEYIDLEKPVPDKKCNVALDFTEPVLDNNIQTQLKKGRATISHIKQKVAKDYQCELEDVLLLSASEDKDRGSYDFCANGTKVTYKRNGFTIIKSRKLF